jgi:alkylhydroperoxidase family enzyme
MAWISKVEPNEATGALKREYAEAIGRAGRVYEILKVQSLKPEYVSASVALYRSSMFGPSKLTRAQREMIAVVVSAANRCHY